MSIVIAVLPLLLLLAVLDHVKRAGLGTPLTVREGGRLVLTALAVLGTAFGVAVAATRV